MGSHYRLILNLFPIPQKNDVFPPACVGAKKLYFFVLLQLRQPNNFRDHVDITHCSDIEIIAPVIDGGGVVDIDIILNIRHTETTIHT